MVEVDAIHDHTLHLGAVVDVAPVSDSCILTYEAGVPNVAAVSYCVIALQQGAVFDDRILSHNNVALHNDIPAYAAPLAQAHDAVDRGGGIDGGSCSNAVFFQSFDDFSIHASVCHENVPGFVNVDKEALANHSRDDVAVSEKVGQRHLQVGFPGRHHAHLNLCEKTAVCLEIGQKRLVHHKGGKAIIESPPWVARNPLHAVILDGAADPVPGALFAERVDQSTGSSGTFFFRDTYEFRQVLIVHYCVGIENQEILLRQTGCGL